MSDPVLSTQVCRLRDEMIAEGYAESYQDINAGNCDEFADRLVRTLQSSSEHVKADTREICDYYDHWEDTGGPLVRAKLDVDLPNMLPPEGMDWKDLDAFIERSSLGWGFHVFVVVNGKAYDSETPEGVDSFFELPVFKRLLAFYGLEKGDHVNTPLTMSR